jgi:hypothetical protein
LCESLQYQLYGFDLEDTRTQFALHDFSRDNFAHLSSLPDISFDEDAVGKQKRLFQRDRMVFRKNDLSRMLPLGEIDTLAILGERYSLALSSSLVRKIYGRKRGDTTEDLILNQENMIGATTGGCSGGYVDLDCDGNWWIPSGKEYFAAETLTPESELSDARKHFFRICRHENPFGHGLIGYYDLRIWSSLARSTQPEYNRIHGGLSHIKTVSSSRSQRQQDTVRV